MHTHTHTHTHTQTNTHTNTHIRAHIARLSGHEDEDPEYVELEAVLHSQRKVHLLLFHVWMDTTV